MDDSIRRQWLMECVIEGWIKFDTEKDKNRFIHLVRDIAPSAQPERLTDDDFEVIRIHLSAYKERLCNQHRWKEAEEYQRIIDRFMSFATAQQKKCSDILEELKDDDYYNYIHTGHSRFSEDDWDYLIRNAKEKEKLHERFN